MARAAGGFQVEDWACGLVDRKRLKKPAYFAVLKVTIAAGTAVMLWVAYDWLSAGKTRARKISNCSPRLFPMGRIVT